MVGLASVVTGVLTESGAPFEVAALAALAVGVIGGAFNGFLVTVVGLPSLAVTIGTLALFRGLAVGLLGTTAVTDFPEMWTALAKAKIAGTTIPYIVIPFLILLAIFVVVLHFTPFGRGIYAIGLSKDAARFSGVNVERTKFILFMLSGGGRRVRRHLLHRSASAVPAATTPPGSSSRSSRPWSSAGCRCSAGAGTCTASSPPCS